MLVMKNKILELFSAYERETEFDGQSINEKMYSALADDLVKLFSISDVDANSLEKIKIMNEEKVIEGLEKVDEFFVEKTYSPAYTLRVDIRNGIDYIKMLRKEINELERALANER